MLRVAAAAASAAFVALVGGSEREASARADLLHEVAMLLPSGTRIVEGEYRERCHDILVLRSPPCMSVRLRPRGTVARRVETLVERAGGRWPVVARDEQSAWGGGVCLRRGGLRACATFQSRMECRRRDRLSRLGSRRLRVSFPCDDALVVERGPPAVFAKLVVPFDRPLPSPEAIRRYEAGLRELTRLQLAELQRRRRARLSVRWARPAVPEVGGGAYVLTLANAGPAPARFVSVVLVEQASQREVGVPARVPVRDLQPDESARVAFGARRDLRENPRPVVALVTWTDWTGTYQRHLGPATVPPARAR